MLDLMFYGSCPSSITWDNVYRCRRCGQGPVMVSDGFLMSHCGNCGNWQGCAESLDIGARWLKSKMLGLFTSLKCRFSSPFHKGSIEVISHVEGGAQ